MHTQRTSGAPEADPTQLQHAILDLLLHEPNPLWSDTELARRLLPPTEPPATLEDALTTLHAAGLIHRLSGFTFPTHAATESARLLLA